MKFKISRVKMNLNSTSHYPKGPYGCKFCQKGFETDLQLVKHIAMKHKEIKNKEQYQCDLCTKSYMHMHHLARHVRETHSPEINLDKKKRRHPSSDNEPQVKAKRTRVRGKANYSQKNKKIQEKEKEGSELSPNGDDDINDEDEVITGLPKTPTYSPIQQDASRESSVAYDGVRTHI